MKFLGIIGVTLLLAFVLGLLSTISPWLSPIVVGIVAFISRLLTRLYNIHKPGALFYVMVCAMGASLPLPLSKIFGVICFFTLGIFLSLLGGYAIKRLDKRKEIRFLDKTFTEAFEQDAIALVDAVFYSMALFLTVYISHALELNKPYWVTMACASILLVENLEAMKKRHVQYLLGASLGLILSIFLLQLNISGLLLVLMISSLYGLSQYYVVRNYAVANIFINPMTILLSTLVRQTDSTSLIELRFVGILLGSFIGLGTAWIMKQTLNHYVTTLSEKDGHK
ncbi:FUSC family protein [Streptococcus halichoeri]|nr:FUSC family protein [Streptococcus halichoeri]